MDDGKDFEAERDRARKLQQETKAILEAAAGRVQTENKYETFEVAGPFSGERALISGGMGSRSLGRRWEICFYRKSQQVCVVIPHKAATAEHSVEELVEYIRLELDNLPPPEL